MHCPECAELMGDADFYFFIFLYGKKKFSDGGVTSKDVSNVFCNCVYMCVCVGCGFVCFLSISFSLSFPRHEIGIPISCVQSVMPAVIG